MNEYANSRIKEYLGKVSTFLTHMSASQRAEVLANIESHIRMLLQKRNPTAPTNMDVDAVMVEMEPPEHYGDEEGVKDAPKIVSKPDAPDRLHILIGAGVCLIVVLASSYWWYRGRPTCPVNELGTQPAVVTPAATQPTSVLDATWHNDWEIMQNTMQPNDNLPGLHPMGWIAGELDPAKYNNRPNWEGSGKHVGLLALHPLSMHEPAKIRFTGRIDPRKPVLCVRASGNVSGDADFLLQCFVNGEKVGEFVVDSSRWHMCQFDISKYLGSGTTPDIEIWNTGGGKNPWSFEHCYIDNISFKTTAASVSVDNEVLIVTNSLAQPQALEALTLSLGQYSGHARIEADYGLRISGVHTISAAWLKKRVGTKYRMSVECQLTEEGEACWWVGGPGYGNSVALGYTCRFNGRRALLCRDGTQMQDTELLQPFMPGQSFRVQVSRDNGHLVIKINEVALFDIVDQEPLPESMNSWIALGSVGGAWTTGVRYRNLTVYAPGEVVDTPLTLTPPVGRPFHSNMSQVYRMDMTAGKLPGEWSCTEPQNVRVEGETMIMQGMNGSPECVLNSPIAGDFALNVKMEYISNDALNFSVPLYFAQGALLDKAKAVQCRLTIPNGDGISELRWSAPDSDPIVLAQTPRYAPIAGRAYGLRIERVGNRVSVFVDGGLLLEGEMPGEKMRDQSVAFIGMMQWYSGMKIHGVSVESSGGALVGAQAQ